MSRTESTEKLGVWNYLSAGFLLAVLLTALSMWTAPDGSREAVDAYYGSMNPTPEALAISLGMLVLCFGWMLALIMSEEIEDRLGLSEGDVVLAVGLTFVLSTQLLIRVV